ncbi:shikimate dehydrogenase [Aquincola sp. MAHUQ-54]|uniref:Shikimate dehydrogenase (NADP(+)) n=1 Tax=Aquincola agrisoli TaxID=3119538 RepID=A0AAW9Q2Q1_9BURK
MTAPAFDLYAVIGNPIQHSQSPFIHAAFARQTGERLEYTRVLSPFDGFRATVEAFAAQGGRGCNVTVPFKLEAPGLAARVSDRAALAGAANVLDLRADGWLADNTDGVGLVRDIDTAGMPIAGRRVLLIGAGGAAAGVLGPLIEARPHEIVVANRTPANAVSLAGRHAGWATRHGVALQAGGLSDPQGRFDIVLNSSASSLQGAPVPVSAGVLAPGALAIDLMYGAAAQPFLDWARAHGAQARDGLGMLVEQAAEAFHFWRGVRPQTAPVLAALRDALNAAAKP